MWDPWEEEEPSCQAASIVAAVEAAIEYHPCLAVHRTSLGRATRLLSEGFNAPKSRRRYFNGPLEQAIEKTVGRSLNLLYATPWLDGQGLHHGAMYGPVALIVEASWAVGYQGDSLFNFKTADVTSPSKLLAYSGVTSAVEVITSTDSLRLVAVAGLNLHTALADECQARGIEYINL